MPTHYGSTESKPKAKKMETKPTMKKATMTRGKMSDKQKSDLKKHMEQHKDLKDMSPSQLKSHRMKMMTRMRKGMTIAQAHKDIKK